MLELSRVICNNIVHKRRISTEITQNSAENGAAP